MKKRLDREHIRATWAAAEREAVAYAESLRMERALAEAAEAMEALGDRYDNVSMGHMREHVAALGRFLARERDPLAARVAHATTKQAGRNQDKWTEAAFLRQLSDEGFTDVERAEALDFMTGSPRTKPAPIQLGRVRRAGSTALDKAKQEAVYRERDAAAKHRAELEQRADDVEAALRRDFAPKDDDSAETKEALGRVLEQCIANDRRQILGE